MYVSAYDHLKVFKRDPFKNFHDSGIDKNTALKLTKLFNALQKDEVIEIDGSDESNSETQETRNTSGEDKMTLQDNDDEELFGQCVEMEEKRMGKSLT